MPAEWARLKDGWFWFYLFLIWWTSIYQRFQFIRICGKRWNLCFLLRFMFVVIGKRDLFYFFCLISRLFCGHQRRILWFQIFFVCQEDVKPLRDLALCLLKKRGWKMNGFGFICFRFGEHTCDCKIEVSVLSYFRKEMKPLFSDCFYVCHIWKEFCFVWFLAHFVDIRWFLVVSDLFHRQEDVKPLRDLALCLLKERGWKMNGFDFICFWFVEHKDVWKRGFSSFLFAGRDETSVFWHVSCLSWLERDLFCFVSHSFCGHV